MTRVAVVILNYNGERLLSQFLPAVISHSQEAEIYVVDNGSTDHSLNILKNFSDRVKVIELKRNFGFCGGYNHSLRQIDADYYVLLNSDVEVTAEWLMPLTRLATTDKTIAAIQPKILSYKHRNKFEYAGAGGGFIDSLGYPFCRGRLFDQVEEDQGQYNDIRPIFWASGACLFIKASVYHHFNGLDEDFFAHMEEIDLCWKINRANLKVYYCGQSTVYHVGAGTLEYESPRKVYLNFRNGLTLLLKHLDAGELFYKLPARIMLDWSASLVFLLRGSTKSAISVWQAHLHFLRSLKRDLRKRSLIRKEYPTYPRINIYKFPIVLEYFLLKKKRIDLNNPR